MSKREGEKREEDRRNGSKNEGNNKKESPRGISGFQLKCSNAFFFFSFAFVNMVRIEGYHHRTGHHHSQEGESTRWYPKRDGGVTINWPKSTTHSFPRLAGYRQRGVEREFASVCNWRRDFSEWVEGNCGIYSKMKRLAQSELDLSYNWNSKGIAG